MTEEKEPDFLIIPKDYPKEPLPLFWMGYYKEPEPKPTHPIVGWLLLAGIIFAIWAMWGKP